MVGTLYHDKVDPFWSALHLFVAYDGTGNYGTPTEMLIQRYPQWCN